MSVGGCAHGCTTTHSPIATTSFDTYHTTQIKENVRESFYLSDDETILLRSGLYLDGKRIEVVLTDTQICWCPIVVGSKHHEQKLKQQIELCNVIFTKYEHKPDKHKKDKNEIELFPGQYFSINFAKRIKHHKWKYQSYTLQTSDGEQCQSWVDTITNKLKDFNRPKNLLVFINPVGGKKLAEKIFKEKVAPYFDLGQIKQNIVVTQRMNYAKDFLDTEDISNYDGVVSVGGDGMFSEVMNGMIQYHNGRHRGKHNKEGKQIAIGIIPAGSTDTVSYCTCGTNDPVTAALHIVLGDRLPLDTCSVWNDDRLLKYSVSLMGYGYFGDLLKESEKLRWMGPKRYDFAGFKKFVTHKTYEGEVSYLETIEDNVDANLRCNTGCKRCSRFIDSTDGNTAGDIMQEEKWCTVRGRFISVIGANISCRCARSSTGLSPHAHTGDGHIDLILVEKTTRAKYLHHMIKTSQKTTDHFDFQFIDVHRVKEFKFRALKNNNQESSIATIFNENRDVENNDHHSVWNVDGELVETPDIHVKVHRQLLHIYARGIEDY